MRLLYAMVVFMFVCHAPALAQRKNISDSFTLIQHLIGNRFTTGHAVYAVPENRDTRALHMPNDTTSLLETTDGNDTLLKTYPAITAAYEISRKDSTILEVHLIFNPSKALSDEIDRLLGNPNVIGGPGLGEDEEDITKAWTWQNLSVLKFIDGPYYHGQIPKIMGMKFRRALSKKEVHFSD